MLFKGVQESIVECVQFPGNRPVSPFKCDVRLKPDSLTRTCNDHPCPPRFGTRPNFSALMLTFDFRIFSIDGMFPTLVLVLKSVEAEVKAVRSIVFTKSPEARTMWLGLVMPIVLLPCHQHASFATSKIVLPNGRRRNGVLATKNAVKMVKETQKQ